MSSSTRGARGSGSPRGGSLRFEGANHRRALSRMPMNVDERLRMRRPGRVALAETFAHSGDAPRSNLSRTLELGPFLVTTGLLPNRAARPPWTPHLDPRVSVLAAGHQFLLDTATARHTAADVVSLAERCPR